jgi:RHS repeat-associated protein
LAKPIEFNFVTDINGLNTEKILKIGNKIDHVNNYEVDSLNRITNFSQTVDSNVKSVAIQYDNRGQLIKQTRFDSGKEIIVTKNQYDLAGRLTNISHTDNSNKTIYADYDLKWDNANRITDFDFTYLNGPSKRNESKYAYDKTSQLINANYNFIQSEKYNFDPNGNRKTAEIQGQKQNYKTGEYNRLLSDENYSYKYDLEGNRISKTDKEGKTIKYTWDNRNRLVKVSTPTNEIEYLYDYLNRLVKRTENKTNQQHFVHDGWQIVLQFDDKNHKPTHRYLWGTKQDELICENNNWTLSDHLNTIRDIIKSDDSVKSHIEYNSFGKIISKTKNDNLSFTYTGKLFDQTSDLQWNINRWYDSNIGRWINEDPIGFLGSSGNLFRYAGCNPISKLDLLGLISNVDIGTINGCWLAQFPNPPDQSLRDRIGNNLLKSVVIDAANSTAISLMLDRIPLPASLLGKITVATLTQVVNAALEKATSGNTPDNSDIVASLLQVLGASAEEDVSVLVPVVTQLLQNTAGYVQGECKTVTMGYSTVQNNISIVENINCVFTVCAKKTVWWGIIGQWSVSGTCNYTCADGPEGTGKRCCHSGFPYKATEIFTSTGTGVGANCRRTPAVP